MIDKPDVDREYLFQERRSLLQRLGAVEELLGIPRSVVPKKYRKAYKQFQEEHRGITLDDYPENDLDVAEGGPN